MSKSTSRQNDYRYVTRLESLMSTFCDVVRQETMRLEIPNLLVGISGAQALPYNPEYEGSLIRAPHRLVLRPGSILTTAVTLDWASL